MEVRCCIHFQFKLWSYSESKGDSSAVPLSFIALLLRVMWDKALVIQLTDFPCQQSLFEFRHSIIRTSPSASFCKERKTQNCRQINECTHTHTHTTHCTHTLHTYTLHTHTHT